MIDVIKEQIQVFSDPDFKFNEEKHRYTYKGRYLPSVTGITSKYKPPFDRDGISKRVAKRDMRTQDEVLAEWEAKAKKATDLGTEVHCLIEQYWLGKYPIASGEIFSDEAKKRFSAFLAFRQKKLPNLEPIAPELRVFSKKYHVAGTIDLLAFNHKDNKVYLFDWKTNGEFKGDLDKAWDNMLPPFADLASNHHNEYSIQLSLYWLILEEWGIEAAGTALVHLPPGGANAVLYHGKDFREQLRAEIEPEKGPEF